MDETEAATTARYWCHVCSQMVNPIMEVETVKCPFCDRGFVEEMDSTVASRGDHHHHHHHPIHDDDYYFGGGGGDSESDRALSLWAPILLGMMSNNPRRRRRFRRRLAAFEDDEDESNHDNNHQHDGETEVDRELESIIRRRRRSSATILRLLHGIRSGILSESDNSERDNRDGNRDTSEIRDRGRVILINPFNQTIIVQDSNNPQNQNHHHHHPVGSLGDYFLGPGLDLLLQHLAENDPNSYGTPPAQKEAVEAMPTVKIAEENLQCSVCLEDFEFGIESKEMPCKHKFHSGCILPWLELHSSCPVCRHQLPSEDESNKLDISDVSRNNSYNSGVESSNNGIDDSFGEDGDGDRDRDARNGNGRRFTMPLPWPLSSLFSSTSENGNGNGNGSGNSSSTASSSFSSTSTNAPPPRNDTDET